MTIPSDTTRRDFLFRMASIGALASRPVRLLAQERLPTRVIPSTGEELPIVGLGSSKPVLEIPTEGTAPLEAVIRTLVSYGGRVVDTSPRPPEIDTEFGRVLQAPDLREELFVAAKINTTGEAAGVAQMRQSQRLFGRPTMDLVQVESMRDVEVHWPNLRRWKDEGEARYIGVTVSSTAAQDRLEEFMRREAPDFVHVNYSVLETRAEERVLPLAQDRGMAVLTNRPFMNGAYFGRVEGRDLPEWVAEFDCSSWAQFTLKYILSNQAVTCALTETSSVDHMAENIQAAFGRAPDRQARARMRELALGF